MSAQGCVDSYHIFDTFKNLQFPSLTLPEINLPSFLKPSEEIKDLRAEALELEKKALSYCGLKLDEEIHIYDVPINFQGSNFIHTVEFGRQNSEILILFPGYCGTAAYMSPLFKGLSKKFRVFHIDFLGQGLSSRPEFTCTTSEETIQYFVDSFEAWREVMKIDSYYLSGHSLGGYIAPMVAHNNPKRCKGMFLMSPKGVSCFDSYEPSEEWVQSLGKVKAAGWIAYFQLYERCFDMKTTPYDLVQRNPTFTKYFFRKYMSGFLKDQAWGEAIGEALHGMLLIPGGSSQCIHLILRPPKLAAYIPLPSCIFPELTEMPIYCYFGVEDWNDWTQVQNYTKESENKNVFYVSIDNSGHQMTMQNPDLVVEKIMSTFESI